MRSLGEGHSLAEQRYVSDIPMSEQGYFFMLLLTGMCKILLQQPRSLPSEAWTAPVVFQIVLPLRRLPDGAHLELCAVVFV